MKNVRLVIVSALAGAVLATSATAFAGPVTNKISALLRPDYTVTVNGKQLKNAPINYNGTTYLPLRETSDAFGARLDIQGKDITIESEAENLADQELNPEEWIPLKELGEQVDSLTLGGNDRALTIKKDEITLVFLNFSLSNTSGTVSKESSDGKKLRFSLFDNTTYVFRADLKELNILP